MCTPERLLGSFADQGNCRSSGIPHGQSACGVSSTTWTTREPVSQFELVQCCRPCKPAESVAASPHSSLIRVVAGTDSVGQGEDIQTWEKTRKRPREVSYWLGCYWASPIWQTMIFFFSNNQNALSPALVPHFHLSLSHFLLKLNIISCLFNNILL